MVYGVKKLRKWTTSTGEVRSASYPKGDSYYLYASQRQDDKITSQYLGVGTLQDGAYKLATRKLSEPRLG